LDNGAEEVPDDPLLLAASVLKPHSSSSPFCVGASSAYRREILWIGSPSLHSLICLRVSGEQPRSIRACSIGINGSPVGVGVATSLDTASALAAYVGVAAFLQMDSIRREPSGSSRPITR